MGRERLCGSACGQGAGPEEWRARVRAWHRLNLAKKTRVDGEPAPDNNEEYLLYQTLLGAWPMTSDAGEHDAFVARIQRFMEKALREAKVHMSWINPSPEYDAAVGGFIARLLDRAQPNEFLDDFLPFQARVSEIGIRPAMISARRCGCSGWRSGSA